MKQHKSSNSRSKNNKEKNSRKNNRKETEENPYYLDGEIYNAGMDEEIFNPEDDPDFINQIEQFEKKHRNSKLIKIYDLIGKPGIKKPDNLSNEDIKNELVKLFGLLDSRKVLVHFKNEYSLIKKYNFIINEILNQVVEDISDTQLHINFIYEDFHPDADLDEGED
ncbi:MAG: hypothetical protein JW917_10815 [Ignavibacteria bacterium]|nr:hypothetical protein [Ignavibacteria bacterium]